MSSLNSPSRRDQEFFLTNTAQLQRWLPWLRMFRGFRIAIDYQKMVIALLAVFLWMQGSLLLTRVFFNADEFAGNDFASRDFQANTDAWGGRAFLNPLREMERLPDRGEPTSVSGFVAQSNAISWPIKRISRSFLGLVNFRSVRWWWHSWVQLVWGLTVCAVFGGAISRMAALELTGHGRSMIRDTIYAVKQFPTSFFSPALALVAFGGLWILCWLAGFVGRVPVLGELLIGIAWGLLLLVGLLMALILIGLILGWPLMFVSSEVEKNDAFDALSRSLSYLLNRPWYAAFLIVIAILYGTALLYFVDWLTRLSVAVSLSSVGTGLGRDVSFFGLPTLDQMREASTEVLKNDLAASLMKFWMSIAILVPVAFSFSYFWCSITIGYFLLRRREDGTPINELDLSDQPGHQNPELPVVGIPAAENREASRES
ncbi:hypothetical protein [Thalassoglobus sp.]|uniref:hypothetical protein n=1 Tax=Thalassoglobus sp. TaxID=2795869 RepID=UPI003AA83E57